MENSFSNSKYNDGTESQSSTDAEWLAPAVFATFLSMLLWALFIAVRLYYGNFKVNKLTFKPLKWAFLCFLAQAIVFGDVTF